VEHLLPGFVEDVRAAGAHAGVAEVEGAGMDLLRRWGEPSRAYHDVRHLAEVLQRLGELAADGAGVGAEVRLAAWFHDAVYTGSPGSDERASADLAGAELRALGVPASAAQRVHDLVLVTATHEAPPGDDGAGALCDADLAVLAAPPDRYEAYVRGVRAEYASVADSAFAAGRAAVLRRLLQRPHLFATDAGRARFESVARANVTAELARLAP
jgi:predicted metal-dependent HD superfamily phosphohydrolase